MTTNPALLHLRQLSDGEVTRFLYADNGLVYLVLLHTLLQMRRRHELAPLHVDFLDAVTPSVTALRGARYAPEEFAADVQQLAEWGCLRKEVEAARIRGYRDRRRDNYRYALGADTVSFLEWLESRYEQRLQGRQADGRDLLLDLVGRLQEALRLIRQRRSSTLPAGQTLDAETARRLLHLLASTDEEADLITADLTALRAEMHAFSRGGAIPDELPKIISGLEQYATRYVHRLRDLGGKAYMSARRLATPASRRVFQEARRMMETDESFLRQRVRDPDELLNALLPFLEPGGKLADSCSRVEEMVADVVRRIHRHLRDLEMRNFRLEELRGRMNQIARLPDASAAPRAFVRALVAFAHFPFDPYVALAEGGKARPPAPRQFREWAGRKEPEALRRSGAPPEIIFQAQDERRRKLRDYVLRVLLKGRREGRLSEARLAPGENPLQWLAVAKAHYLAQGREIERCGVVVSPLEGKTELASDGRHLETIDHRLAVKDITLP